MRPPLASVIIPTYQHAATLRQAIESVLEQSAPCEAIVVDDGSTDGTAAVLQEYADDARVRVLRVPHGGPSKARNAGLELAQAEFVMFLDADDLITSDKVRWQLDEFAANPEADWVLCDVQIEDEATGRSRPASVQYRYDQKDLGGWIHDLLLAGNFIPIMSPLIRRSVIPAWLRFDDQKVPEDWHFWCELSMLARVRYVPIILATYRHRRTGRSRLPKASRTVYPTIESPLRLNLGCGTPNTRSWHPMRGLVNLDKSMGWRFEDGLKEFPDHSVAGITISHALMYLPEADWPGFLSDVSRVLVEGGVVRVTEDDTEHPQSSRRGGWKGSEPAVTLTTPEFVKAQMSRAGLLSHDVTRDTTRFINSSLIQAQHGEVPDVFFVEGVKLCGTFFSPHSDDETLFGAFTILRYRPRVVVCCPSAGDYGDTETREKETRDAMSVLGSGAVEQWQGGDLVEQMRAFDARVHPVRVWAPSMNASHPDHVAVATAAAAVFGDRVSRYHTYVMGTDDVPIKVRLGDDVPYEPIWVQHKLRALARYTSQLSHPRASQFFAMDLYEYTAKW